MKRKVSSAMAPNSSSEKRVKVEDSTLSPYYIFGRTDKRERVTLEDLVNRERFKVLPAEHLNIPTKPGKELERLFIDSGYLSTFPIKENGHVIDTILRYADSGNDYLHFIFIPKRICEEIRLSGGTEERGENCLFKKEGTVWQLPHYNTINPQVFYTSDLVIALREKQRTDDEVLLGGKGLIYARFVSIPKKEFNKDGDMISELAELLDKSSYHYYAPQTLDADLAAATQQQEDWKWWSKLDLEDEGPQQLLKFALSALSGTNTPIKADSPYLRVLREIHQKLADTNKKGEFLEQYLDITRTIDETLIRGIKYGCPREQADTLRRLLKEAVCHVLNNEMLLTESLITALRGYSTSFSREMGHYQRDKSTALILLPHLDIDFNNPDTFPKVAAIQPNRNTFFPTPLPTRSTVPLVSHTGHFVGKC
ncbi:MULTISPECIES: hypothetical protein [unclassified Legionella]|uniref:hypothetical protein n=1 Tax=unclassified Legionella TaxID=2622702 RepID=UPI001E29A53A|nr:hypothetical protein [Legionella sp. 31fI33]MCC5013612.1 hypothetical protein [Legionella sp. 31fI33]